jgi:hypothetical protein
MWEYLEPRVRCKRHHQANIWAEQDIVRIHYQATADDDLETLYVLYLDREIENVRVFGATGQV